MRKITVLSMITLDGVMQGPGGPTEDESGGFTYGGWVAPLSDDEYNNAVREELQPADYLLGRKTYEIWAGYWPHHGAFWPSINANYKYVFSQNLSSDDPMVTGWNNSEVINSVEGIKGLKNSPGRDIQVWGSSKLVPLLLEHKLVDELRLKIHPVTLGIGKRLFGTGTIPTAFTLTNSSVTPKGVILVNYKFAGDVKTGAIGEV